ncbi:MFS transporter superfamily protein [Pleurotus pulmonarius]
MSTHKSSERDLLLPNGRSKSSLPSSYTRTSENAHGGESEGKQQPSTPQVSPSDISKRSRHLILMGIWLAQFLSSLNLTLVPTMLAFIASDFKKANQASWLGTSYLLATTAFTPLYGRLANAMGRRGAIQSALLFAGVGIILCGVSASMEQLIAARFLSGMGGGGIFTMAAIITSDMYNLRTRGFIQSIGGIFYGLGMGLGGPIGGFITDWLGWRWAFLIQIPFFVLSFLLVSLNLQYTTEGSGKTPKEIIKRIDYGGIITLMGTVASLLLFLSARYNEDHPWTDRSVYAPLALTLIFLICFLLIEARLAIEPILPTYLLSHRVPVLVGTSSALVATVMGTSASVAGLHLLPNSVCISTGSIFAGWMMKKYGAYKLLNMVFGCLPFIAAATMATMSEHSGVFKQWIAIMPLGFGNAIVLQTMYIALVANLPASQMAIGTGFSQLLRGLGQVGGLAISSALFQSVLKRELSKRIRGDGAQEIISKIRHASSAIHTLPPPLQQAARDAFAVALRSVFILAATASLLAYLARIPIPDKNLEEEEEDGQSGREGNTATAPKR